MPSTSEHTNGTTETINGNGNGYGIVNGNGNGNGHPNSNGIDNTPNDKANHPVICVLYESPQPSPFILSLTPAS